MNQEPWTRPAVLDFLFDQLVVGRTIAEARRQNVLEDADHVRIQERDSTCGQFLEPAATPSPYDARLIAQ